MLLGILSLLGFLNIVEYAVSELKVAIKAAIKPQYS